MYAALLSINMKTIKKMSGTAINQIKCKLLKIVCFLFKTKIFSRMFGEYEAQLARENTYTPYIKDKL